MRWAAATSASEAFEGPVVRTDLTRRLAVGVLECFPLTWDRELRSLSMTAQARRYRGAVAAVAARWGSARPGRSTAAYRATCGVARRRTLDT